MDLIERLPNDAYVAKKQPYVDVFGLLPIFKGVAFHSNTILSGPKGIGKSMAFAAYAYETKTNIVTYDCSEDVRRAHVIGTPTMRGHETPFIMGPIPTAYEIANETGACILCFEEINALSPQMQKLLNSSTDFRRRVEVPEAKKVFELKNGAKLWVVGTMNTAVYGGVYALNEDLKSRFDIYPLDYPKDEHAIIQSEMADRGFTVAPDIIQKVLTISTETRQKAIEYALSPRDVVQILSNIARVGVKDALWIASGKFDDTDRKFFQDRVWDNFDNLLLPGATAPAKSSKQAQAQTPPRP